MKGVESHEVLRPNRKASRFFQNNKEPVLRGGGGAETKEKKDKRYRTMQTYSIIHNNKINNRSINQLGIRKSQGKTYRRLALENNNRFGHDTDDDTAFH